MEIRFSISQYDQLWVLFQVNFTFRIFQVIYGMIQLDPFFVGVYVHPYGRSSDFLWGGLASQSLDSGMTREKKGVYSFFPSKQCGYEIRYNNS